MTGNTFYEKIAQTLSNVLANEVSPAQLNDDTDLIIEMGLNSLDFLQFIIKLENEFDIEIDIEKLDIQYFRKLGKLKMFIEEISKKNNVA
jgi:acyl carrier protein